MGKPVYTLTIQPGVTLRFPANTGMNIFGALNAQGTSGAPITFTGKTQTPGFWYGIDMYATLTSPSILDYCVIEYGGANTWNANMILRSNAIIQNSTIRYSDGYGLLVHFPHYSSIRAECHYRYGQRRR